MIDLLNACIFCFGVPAVIGLIIGHEDGLVLAILALAAVMLRVVIGGGRVRRDGRKPKAGT